MNIPNNERKKNSISRIKEAFIELLKTKNVYEINVTDLAKKAKVNRSTFYVNYTSVHDLAEQLKKEVFDDIIGLYTDEVISGKHSYDYLKLFKHIKENQTLYNILFKLNFDFGEYYDYEKENEGALKYYGTLKNIDYHVAFFKAGMDAIIKKWLHGGCKESPEEMMEILSTEYNGKSLEN